MGQAKGRRFNRLLLIDDEPGIRRMMSLDLEADGYEVLTAEDGYAGLDVFDQSRPDVVLTDIKMPGLDGLDVLRQIKEVSPETEVIVITGHGDMDTAIKSLQLEASDFITKPINPEALEVALKRARERLALKAELADYTKSLEAKVEEAAEKLVAAERLAAVGQTVAALGHSIKNMLGGLRGGAYMIQEGLAKENIDLSRQGLVMLERNLRRVADFVSDLLTLAKPRQPELAPVDLSRLAAEAAEILGPVAEAKGVELAAASSGSGPVVEAEAKAILDALLNLLSNAVDAAAEVKAGRVSLEVKRQGGRAWFEVRDNGPGLTKEAAANIFQGFYSSKGASGTGLGLMVAQKTAQEHGGGIDFENLAGGGAVFRLALPLKGNVSGETVPGGHEGPLDPGLSPEAPRGG